MRDAKDIDSLDLDPKTHGSVSSYFTRLAFFEAAEAQGITLPDNHQNLLISGPTGVGKSTLAKAIGQKLVSERTQSTPLFFVKPAQLIGRYRGHSQKNMQELLEMAEDGIIIFDEIDTYLDLDSDDRMILNVLNTHLGDRPNHPIVFATLYEHNRARFLGFNTGMQSRFGSVVGIQGQDSSKLSKIFENAVAKTGMPYDPAVTQAVESLINQIRQAQRGGFGHIREVDNILGQTITNMSQRHAADPDNFTFEVTLDDIPVRDRQTGALMKRASHTPLPKPADEITEAPSNIVPLPKLTKD